MKYTLILFAFLFGTQVFAQVNAGIGISGNAGFLTYESQMPLQNVSVDASVDYNVGANLFVEFANASAFSYRIMTHLNQKKLAIVQTTELTNGGEIKESDRYYFNGLDLSMTASYALPNKPQWHPRLGLMLSFNRLGKVGRSLSSVNTDMRIERTTNLEEGFERNHQSFTRPAIQAGVSFRPSLFLLKRQVEFNLDGYFSPINYLENPILFNNIAVQGQYHFASFGMNLFLNKKE